MPLLNKVHKVINSIELTNELIHRIQTSPMGLIYFSNDGVEYRDTRRHETDKRTKVDIVGQIKKIPGLKYMIHKDASCGYRPQDDFIAVTDEVGNLIEVYIKSDRFAGMELKDFLLAAGISYEEE